MADPINPRTPRAYDPQRQSGADDAERGGSGDPLAELARLIGQNDPFADFERKRAAGETQHGSRAPAAQSPRDWQEPRPHPEQYPPSAHAHYTDQPQYSQQSEYSDQAYEPAADAYNQYYDTGEALDEADYQEQEDRRRRNRRLAAVIGILALAVVGGAGAYGYRTFVGSTVSATPPPVIKADTTPAKVIPATQAGDSASNKLIYDRVGEPGQAERVVPREEKPVDIKTATVTQPPRVAYPAPDANAVAAPPSATIPISGQAAGGQVLPAASSATPRGGGVILPSAKKVRTVTIRPDMSVVPAVPTGPEPQPRAAEPVPSTRSVAPQPSSPPPAPAPARPAPAPQRQAVAPLSLSPGAAPPVQSGANEPQPTGAGSFLVQVSSQRSEVDANASYKALQTRYPDMLGSRSSIVRRADLGSKGVFYRAMVGPFASGEEAVQFCTSLKAAGGQCVIHRN